MTVATFTPGGSAIYKARCGIVSDKVKDFSKTGGFIKSTLAGVDCPECMKGICYEKQTV